MLNVMVANVQRHHSANLQHSSFMEYQEEEEKPAALRQAVGRLEHSADHMVAAHFEGFEPEDEDGYCGDEHEDAIDLDGEARSQREMLKQVERIFIDYFLRKVGPSRKTEQVRESVFQTLTQILDSKYGKCHLIKVSPESPNVYFVRVFE